MAAGSRGEGADPRFKKIVNFPTEFECAGSTIKKGRIRKQLIHIGISRIIRKRHPMPIFKKALLSVLVSAVFPAWASAQGSGLIVGVDVTGGTAHGSSNTTNGGAPFAGGGTVSNLKLGNTVGIGGHLGYKFSDLSVFVSYQHVNGNVSWDAAFPAVGVASSYAGSATSDTLLANAAYDFHLSRSLLFRTSAGVGVAFNKLSGVTENDVGTGLFLSNVADHTQVSPAAQVGVGLRYEVMPRMELGVDAAIAYTGGFQTGNTRTGNLGVTDIVPYKINNVWRPSVGASFQYRF